MKYLQIHLDNPCTEAWGDMTSTEKGRFCTQCAKTVVDFTHMTDAEMLNFFKKNQGKEVCGRINPHQLVKPLPLPAPAPVRYAQAFALAAGLALTSATQAETPNLPRFEVVDGQDTVELNQIEEERPSNVPNNITFKVKPVGEKCTIEITMFGVKKQMTDSLIVFGMPKSKVKKTTVTVKVTFADARIKEVNEKINLVLSDKNAFGVKIEAIAVMGKMCVETVKVKGKKVTLVKQTMLEPFDYRVIIFPTT
jgi:hypothetical protein